MEMHKSALVSSTGLSSLLENCPQMQTQFACIMRRILPPNAKAKVKCKNLNLYHCFFCFFLQSKLIKKKSTARPVLGAGFFHQLRKNTKSRTKISVYLADFLCFPVVLCVCVCVCAYNFNYIAINYRRAHATVALQGPASLASAGRSDHRCHKYSSHIHSTDISAWQVTTYNFRSETSGLQLSYEHFYFI